MTLTITGREWGTEKRWVDDKRLLESRFAEILATFLDLVPRQKRLRSVREAEAAKRRAQEIVDSERRWKEAEEQREFEEVLKESEAHQSMVKFQQYLDGIEKHITESQEQLSKKGAAWLARMRLRVAETDPFLYRVESLVEKKS